MKKIRPVAWFVPLMLIAAAGYVFLGTTYMRQQREQEELVFQIDQLRPAIAEGRQNTDEPDRQRLAAIQALLTEVRATFPSDLRNTAVVDWIQQMAQQSPVQRFVIEASPISSEKIGENNYNVLRIVVRAEGTFPQFKALIRRLEKGAFTTLVMDRVNMTLSGAGSVSLNLGIYSHPLPPGTVTTDPK